MYILNSKGTVILNSDFIERFSISVKADGVSIMASYTDQRMPIGIGRYADEKEARKVLGDLFAALSSDAAYFEMSESRLYAGQEWIRDARTKRKGGS